MNTPGLSASSIWRSKGSAPCRGFRLIRGPVSRSSRCQNRLPVSHLSVSLPRSVSAPTTEQVGYNHPDEAKVRSMAGKDAKSTSDRKGEGAHVLEKLDNAEAASVLRKLLDRQDRKSTRLNS